MLADTATKYDINLNFTQFCFVLHYTELQRMKEFFISLSSFLVHRNSFVYPFSLVFSRHQFQVSMLQVLPTTTPHLQQTAAAQFQMLLPSSFPSVRCQGDSTHEKQLKREVRHETREI
jgi:hypothetical protein